MRACALESQQNISIDNKRINPSRSLRRHTHYSILLVSSSYITIFNVRMVAIASNVFEIVEDI